MVDCTFIDNWAGLGGAIYVYACSLSLSGLHFESNISGQDGGALIVDIGGTVTINDCTFHDNDGDYGGAICLFGGATAILDGVTLTDNTATKGGALYCQDSDVIATDCLFAGNGSPEGGAVELTRTMSISHFADCTFAYNTANNGGAVFVHEATLELLRCTLHANAANQMGGGVRCWYDGDLAAENTIIANSTAGEAIACYTGTTIPALSCCDIFGNAGGDYIGCLETLAGVAGNISADPLFCDPEAGNFHVIESSPCAPFTIPNTECDLIGAWTAGCNPQAVPEGRGCADGLRLRAVTPNPFGRCTEITYAVTQELRAGTVSLAIYDAGGRLVHSVNELPGDPGIHRVGWDGRDVPGGIYFCELRAGSSAALERLVLVR